MAHLYGWTTFVEVGVWKGDTAAHLLTHVPMLKWVGVDPYRIPAGAMDQPGYCNYGHVDMDAVYRATNARTAVFNGRGCMIREPSVKAASNAPDGFYDAVFLDGDHRAEHVRADIQAWKPKVKSGGWLLGHDYDMPSVFLTVRELLPEAHALPDRMWGIQC